MAAGEPNAKGPLARLPRHRPDESPPGRRRRTGKAPSGVGGWNGPDRPALSGEAENCLRRRRRDGNSLAAICALAFRQELIGHVLSFFHLPFRQALEQVAFAPGRAVVMADSTAAPYPDEPEAAREADVAISMADDLDPARDPAQVLVLRPDLGWIAGLRERSRSHIDCLRAVHSFVLIPNIACVAGAFFLGFTSLYSVILTNLGTFAIYTGLPRRRSRSLLASTGRLRASSDGI